ncbi:putative fimbrial chaperone domain protein [Burkholderia pseudomallei MSHR2990]|nr:putative fimbrial chaperone domain protein [Burkholderia pseudomallei MSHR2990]
MRASPARAAAKDGRARSSLHAAAREAVARVFDRHLAAVVVDVRDEQAARRRRRERHARRALRIHHHRIERQRRPVRARRERDDRHVVRRRVVEHELARGRIDAQRHRQRRVLVARGLHARRPVEQLHLRVQRDLQRVRRVRLRRHLADVQIEHRFAVGGQRRARHPRDAKHVALLRLDALQRRHDHQRRRDPVAALVLEPRLHEIRIRIALVRERHDRGLLAFVEDHARAVGHDRRVHGARQRDEERGGRAPCARRARESMGHVGHRIGSVGGSVVRWFGRV